MNNASTYRVNLTYKQILDIVKQLPQNDKAKLGKEIAKEIINKRLTKLLNAFKTDELDENTIIQEVEKVRAELYEKKKN
jgi:hypothetical protein